MEILKQHYQFVFIAVGIFILVGAICRWQWLVIPSPDQHNKPFISFILETFGEQGYRVFMGACGVLLIISGLVFWVYG